MRIELSALESLPPEHQLLVLEEEELRRLRTRKISRLFPEDGPLSRHAYRKHTAFFRWGATHRQRAFMAANRVGKSYAGLYELALHTVPLAARRLRAVVAKGAPTVLSVARDD